MYFSKETELDTNEVLRGFARCENVVTSTMGPFGRNVFVFGEGEPTFTKDGITALRYNSWAEPLDRAIAQLLIDAATKTLRSEGDGTTTTVLLASRLAHRLLPSIAVNANIHSLLADLERIKKEVIEQFKAAAMQVANAQTVVDVATIAANGDKVLGELIGKLAYSVGEFGTIIAQTSTTSLTHTKQMDGWMVDSKEVPIPLRPEFILDISKRCTELDEPLIVLTDITIRELSTIQPIMDIWQKGNKESSKMRPLVFVVQDMEGAPLATIVGNLQRGIPIFVIKAPYFMENRADILEDMRILTGAKRIFSNMKGASMKSFTAEDFGSCSKLTFWANRMVLQPREDSFHIGVAVEKRKADLKKALSNVDLEEMQSDFIKMRLARFDGGIGFIYVGGQTEVESKNLFMVVDDAQRAAFSAMKGGVVVGGGATFLAVKRNIELMYRSDIHGIDKVFLDLLEEPFNKIANLACISAEEVEVAKMKVVAKFGTTFDHDNYKHKLVYSLTERQIVDGVERGIIEPVRVPIAAIENAVSIVKLFIQSKIGIELQNIK